MLARFTDSPTFIFLCQSADWQCVVDTSTEELAATAAIEAIMKSKIQYSLGAVIAVQKLVGNFFDKSMLSTEPEVFYTPMILANAGFHVEAANLSKIVEQKDKDGGFKKL